MYAAILVLAVTTNFEYNDHIFGLNNGSTEFVLINDSGWLPKYQAHYVVQNIGRTPIDAQVWYGTKFQWFGVIHGATIYPGETKTISNDERRYYVTGLKLLNPYKTRAIAYGKIGDFYLPCTPRVNFETGDLYTPYVPSINFDPFPYLMKTLKFCVKYLRHNPVTGIFAELAKEFWSHNEKHSDIWEEVVDNIKPLLRETELLVIEKILQGKLSTYKDKIASLDKERNGINIREHYIHIAYEMIGLEQQFYFPTSNSNLINFYTLPLYSNVVSMKINFYILGIRNKDKIGLSDIDIKNIFGYANRTFENATNYIKSMLKEPIDHTYNTVDAQSIFNSMMTVRSHLAMHGEEYLPIWQYQLSNPFSDKKVNNSVMTYSRFFGRATPNLFAQATPVHVPAPLCPELINDQRDTLTAVTFYLHPNTPCVLTIGGAVLHFESGSNYELGFETAIVKKLELEGAAILKLTVFGAGQVDGLTFYLSNGTQQSFGTIMSETYEDFELPEHRIASFYLSSAGEELGGQAANIAVSYQRYDIS